MKRNHKKKKNWKKPGNFEIPEEAVSEVAEREDEVPTLDDLPP